LPVSMLDQVINFTTVFLGIFIEAAPFLLLGTVASGLVEVFVSKEELSRMLPSNPVMAALVGGVMGFAFPVCECGVVPLTRRLFKKGLPVAAGVAFLLAAPIVNPVVLASTFAAYGFGKVLIARFGFGLLVAVAVGLIFSFNPSPTAMLRLQTFTPGEDSPGSEAAAMPADPLKVRLHQAMRIAADEFFEMGLYLVIGSLLAALMQTIVPQSFLLALGSGPFASVVVMQALAFVLSVCSTVDAFISLAFVNTFSTGAVLSFLVFGPMVDIKSLLMFTGVFQRKFVAYLVVLPFLMVMLIGVFINLNVSW
jgi:uncharacterized membrane protein YraQ (UPF0718 family)